MLLANWYLVVAMLMTATAAYYDARTGHIPDWISYGPGLLAPLVHALIYSRLTPTADLSEIALAGGLSFAGALLCALVPLVLFRSSALGGGDVKQFIALGSLCQITVGVEVQLYTFVLAAIIAPAQLAYHGRLGATLKNCGILITNLFVPKERRKELNQETMSWFRLGPCIFLATLLTAFLHWGEP